MTEAALHSTADLLATEIGLRLDPSSRARLERCLRTAAARLDLDLPAYADLVRNDREALFELLDELTVQESSFFRDSAQFDVLRDRLLPHLAAPAVPVRIWSAGCANGQEPYSLAMLLDEAGVEFNIVATDVSRAALRRTAAGRYSEREMAGVDSQRRARHFRKVGEDWELHADLRNRVQVKHHNLVRSPPPIPARSVPVIFCRNVLIYLGSTERLRVLRWIAEWLPPGGHLFVGGSETLWRPPNGLEPRRWGNAFSYCAVSPIATAEAETAAASPVQEPARPPVPVSEPPRALPDALALLRSGSDALADGDTNSAIASFRKASYLEPHLPIAHFHLGLALESSGQNRAARRAYAAARAALARTAAEDLVGALEGFDITELARVLDDKLERL